MWAPGPVAGRAHPPSATLAAVVALFSTLAVASTYSLARSFSSLPRPLALAFILVLVISSFSFISLPDISRATRTLYAR